MPVLIAFAQSGAPVPAPDDCGKIGDRITSGWSVIEAASGLSALAGIIAFGLLPVATIILAVPPDWLLSKQSALGESESAVGQSAVGQSAVGQSALGEDEREARAQARRAALLLLMPALFTLILAAVFFALISGELYCRRASVMAVPAAVLLGVGSLAMFVAVTWALRAYVQDQEVVVSRSSWVCAFLWAITNAELWFTVVNSVHHLGNTSIYGIAWENNFAVGFGVGLASVLVYRWWLRASPAGVGLARVKRSALMCLAALGLMFVTYQVGALRSPNDWRDGPPGWILAVTGVSALAALAAGALLLQALPSQDEETSLRTDLRTLIKWLKRSG